jgi:hypothetical protein
LEIRLFKIFSDSVFEGYSLSGHLSKSELIIKTAGLPIVKCSCGYKILLLPSVKAMSQAIEAHVETHNRKIKIAAEAKKESERVRLNLIEQVFDLALRL